MLIAIDSLVLPAILVDAPFLNIATHVDQSPTIAMSPRAFQVESGWSCRGSCFKCLIRGAAFSVETVAPPVTPVTRSVHGAWRLGSANRASLARVFPLVFKRQPTTPPLPIHSLAKDPGVEITDEDCRLVLLATHSPISLHGIAHSLPVRWIK